MKLSIQIFKLVVLKDHRSWHAMIKLMKCVQHKRKSLSLTIISIITLMNIENSIVIVGE